MNRRSFIKSCLAAACVPFLPKSESQTTSPVTDEPQQVFFVNEKYRNCLVRRDYNQDWHCYQMYVGAPDSAHYTVWFVEDDTKTKELVDLTIDHFERMGWA